MIFKSFSSRFSTIKFILCYKISKFCQKNFRYELKNIEIVWIIRHNSISAAYFDKAAAKFLEPNINRGREKDTEKLVNKTKNFKIVHLKNGNLMDSEKIPLQSCALGPHWLEKLEQPAIVSFFLNNFIDCLRVNVLKRLNLVILNFSLFL